MKNLNKRIIPKIAVLGGACLLLIAAIVLISWQGNIHYSMQKSEEYVQTLQALIPEPQGAALEERRDNTMTMLSVDKIDFIGILEMPRFNSKVPVCAYWGNVSKYPCCFSGSIYDRTMQIGATSQKGQYDFYREISVGDTILFTDMEGNRYNYTITNLRYAKHADQSSLNRTDSALTLFIKNMYDFEYLIISCNVSN